MSLSDLLVSLGTIDVPLYATALAAPPGLWAWGRFAPTAKTSRAFGHVASSAISVGLILVVLEVLVLGYLRGKGVDLFTGVPALAILAPPWLAFGGLFAATRVVPFAELRRYPLLKRVWATLSMAALVFVAWIVLSHTVWLVVSGLLGFAVVAFLGWRLFVKLARKATDPDHEP